MPRCLCKVTEGPTHGISLSHKKQEKEEQIKSKVSRMRGISREEISIIKTRKGFRYGAAEMKQTRSHEVPSLASLSGLRIWCCCELWCRCTLCLSDSLVGQEWRDKMLRRLSICLCLGVGGCHREGSAGRKPFLEEGGHLTGREPP